MVDAAIPSHAEPIRAERLAAFSRVSTTDLDEAAEAIGRIFCPHVLDPVQRSWPDFHAQHNCAALNGCSVNYVSYGGSVAIDPGCLDRFFLLQIPLQGGARIDTGGRTIEVSAGRSASLLSPTMPTQMVWHDHCAKLILLVERQLVEQRAAALEVATKGVTVNAVCPGFTETDLLEDSIDNIISKTGRTREQAIAELSKHNPQGRLVTPAEVADAVLYLCRPGASAITGQAIAVAGGEI